MQYIILSDGQGSRWNNYMGITKQEAIINGERIIDRICRLLKDCNQEHIKILSSNPNHSNNMSIRIESKYKDLMKHMVAYDYLDQETTLLYGDTYYEEEAIKQIIEDRIDDVMFYGNEKAIVGVKIKDYSFFKQIINKASIDEHSIYNCFRNIDKKYRFKSVGYTFSNINTSEDYERIKKEKENYKKLVLKNE